jgi:hypothetical protein
MQTCMKDHQANSLKFPIRSDFRPKMEIFLTQHRLSQPETKMSYNAEIFTLECILYSPSDPFESIYSLIVPDASYVRNE